MIITKPQKCTVPLSQALGWRNNGRFIFTRKYDGKFAAGGVRMGRNVLICERVVPKSGGKFTESDLQRFREAKSQDRPQCFYAAHSLAVLDGQDVRKEPAIIRWTELCRMLHSGAHFASDGAQIVVADCGNGGEFLDAVIKAGGEGVVAVPVSAPWGFIYAAKAVLEVFARVCGKDVATGCLDLADAVSGAQLGRVTARAHFDMVNVGDIVEVHCMERHKSGKLREARFITIRNDKKYEVSNPIQ